MQRPGNYAFSHCLPPPASHPPQDGANVPDVGCCEGPQPSSLSACWAGPPFSAAWTSGPPVLSPALLMPIVTGGVISKCLYIMISTRNVGGAWGRQYSPEKTGSDSIASYYADGQGL